MDRVHSENKGKRITSKNSKETGRAKDYSSTSGNGNSETKSGEENVELNKKRRCDPLQICGSPKSCSLDGPCMMPLLTVASGNVVEECNSNITPPIIVLTGTARKAGTGPSVGAVDIGVGKSAYFFQVALPGVKKDPAGEFRCEIERDGKVHIRGMTSTGGKVVKRQSRVFEMKYQQQSPPGPFTLSFSLPGPVDPRLFFPNFRSDGILEAVIAKY